MTDLTTAKTTGKTHYYNTRTDRTFCGAKLGAQVILGEGVAECLKCRRNSDNITHNL